MLKHFLTALGPLSLAAMVTLHPGLVPAKDTNDSNPHPRYQNRSAPSRSSTSTSTSSTSGNNWGSKLNELRSSRSSSIQSRPTPSRSPSPSTRNSYSSSRSGVSTPTTSPRYEPPSRSNPPVNRSGSAGSLRPSDASRVQTSRTPYIDRDHRNPAPKPYEWNRVATPDSSRAINRSGRAGDIRGNDVNPIPSNRTNQVNRVPGASVPNSSWQNRIGQARNRSNPGNRSGVNLGLRSTVSPNPARNFNPYGNGTSRSNRSTEDDLDGLFHSGTSLRGQVRSSAVSVRGRDNRDGTNFGQNRGGRELTGSAGGRTRPDRVGKPGNKGIDPPRERPDDHRGQGVEGPRRGPRGGDHGAGGRYRDRNDENHRFKGPGNKDGSHPDRVGKPSGGGGYHFGGLSHLHWRNLGYGRGYYTYPSLWWDIRYSSRFYPGLTYSHRRSSFGYYYGPFIRINGYRYYTPYYYDDAYYDVYYDDTYYDASRQTNRVVLYENPHYRGRNLELYAGQSIADLSHYQTGSDRSFDDLLSSAKIYGDVTLVLYEDANFHGDHVYLHYSVDDFFDETFTLSFDDKVSSVEVLPGINHWHGYEVLESEEGFPSGEPNLSSQASPAAVESSIPLPPEVDSVHAREEQLSVSETADSGVAVILYDQPGFGGHRLELSVGDVIPNLAMRLRDVGRTWDDAVASLQVVGGAEVFLYTESDFYGAGIVLDFDVANFSLSPSLTDFAGEISSIVVKPQ